MSGTGPLALFRPKALRQRGHRLGETRVSLPVSLSVLTTLLVTVAVGVGVLLQSVEYARKETVLGYVTPAGGTVDVHPPRAGIIEAVFVEPGQEVEAGQRLFSVREPGRMSEGAGLAESARERIDAQIVYAEAEFDALGARHLLHLERLEKDMEATRKALTRTRALEGLAAERLALAQDSFEARTALAGRGAISSDQLRQAQVDLLAAEAGLRQAERERLAQEAKLDDLMVAQREAVAERAVQVAGLEMRVQALHAQRLEWLARSAVTAVAPRSGMVAVLQASPGQPAEPQRPALSLVPDGAPLEVRLLIPSRAKGFVEPGLAVRLRYDAFPYQRFGAGHGVVTELAGAALAGPALNGPIAAREPVYIAAVRLVDTHISDGGRRYPLQPGMTVQADIILAQRRLASWLIEPLLRVRG